MFTKYMTKEEVTTVTEVIKAYREICEDLKVEPTLEGLYRTLTERKTVPCKYCTRKVDVRGDYEEETNICDKCFRTIMGE